MKYIYTRHCSLTSIKLSSWNTLSTFFFFLKQQDRYALIQQLDIDTKFLNTYHIMDYSLLIGIGEENNMTSSGSEMGVIAHTHAAHTHADAHSDAHSDADAAGDAAGDSSVVAAAPLRKNLYKNSKEEKIKRRRRENGRASSSS